MNSTVQGSISRQLGVARRALKVAMKLALENGQDEWIRETIGPLEVLTLQLQTFSAQLPWIAPSTKSRIEVEMLEADVRQAYATALSLGLYEVKAT